MRLFDSSCMPTVRTVNAWAWNTCQMWLWFYSIWTIDLAYLLRQFDVSLAFFTVTLGANPDYATESFYMDHMLEDQHRVNKLFEGAELHDIPIYHGSLPVENLMRICHSGLYTVITLVEKGTLWKSITTESSWQDSLWGVTRGFIGHYVVICGCNLVRNEFLIKDPAISNPNGVWISADDFDAARRSFGTDEDMLIVSMHEIRSISGSGMDLSALISDSS